MGRFLQTYPIGYNDGMNLYRYCMNNPLNTLDPFGLLCDSTFGGGGLAIPEAMDIVYSDVLLAITRETYSTRFEKRDQDDSSELSIEAKSEVKYKYTWEPPEKTTKSARRLCKLLKLVATIWPDTSGQQAAEAFKRGWCILTYSACLVWCEDDVDKSRWSVCVKECFKEKLECLLRASKGDCKMEFKVEFN